MADICFKGQIDSEGTHQYPYFTSVSPRSIRLNLETEVFSIQC